MGPPMLHAVKDIHSILTGVARALKSVRYGEAPDELPLRLVNLVERLEGQLAKTTRLGKATRSDLPLRDDL
jgi:hypothetical protein